MERIRLFLLTCLLRGMTMMLRMRNSLTSVSTHMPLARHDFFHTFLNLREGLFLLTCLLRGMTCPYHSAYLRKYAFLLTCLLRGMTKSETEHAALFVFLLTCLLRGMTESLDIIINTRLVSTHMPLARHDYSQNTLSDWTCRFYSHASCEA